MLQGLPELQELNLYGNKIVEITVPSKPSVLSKLEKLDLGYNDLVYLPVDLDQLKSLRSLCLMNNFLSFVPMRVCQMDLKTIDVSSNPVSEPPMETCARGISSMRRYWQCIRLEEQSKQKALKEVQRKAQQRQKQGSQTNREPRVMIQGKPVRNKMRKEPRVMVQGKPLGSPRNVKKGAPASFGASTSHKIDEFVSFTAK